VAHIIPRTIFLLTTEHMAVNRPATLIFEVKTEADFHTWRPVYLTGNFNNWKTDDPALRFTCVRKGVWRLRLKMALLKGFQQIEYKFTRGSWNEMELLTSGQPTKNRVLTDFSKPIETQINQWGSGEWPEYKPFLPKIEIMGEALYLPSLDVKRRVFALLPHDYHSNLSKRYPVLYLQDAQNLFNPENPYGNWGIDIELCKLARHGYGDVIVIAVEHGGKERIDEFSPIKTKFGRGKARNYVKALAETIKPAVDARYRTLPGRMHTGIGGSSMGGLVSIYGGLIYPQTFGRLMIFSPSLWVTSRVRFNTITFYEPEPTRIYCYGGSKEGSNMIGNLRNFKRSIKEQALDHNVVKFELSIDPEGRHTETRWGKEFARAVHWLFFQ
jgi:predicted alpha/beta superfamily hydrolase